MVKNPIIWSDFPDLDPIRVGDTYYMVSTTMYLLPGCVILRSYDLMHWEIAAYVYDRLDDTPAQRLNGGEIYGKGMWAASLRYHNGKFYIIFICNDTQKTYLYTAESIEGPWEKRNIEGFYHDCSLLFDDDGRVYLISGCGEIRLTELKPDLSGPLPGGRDRIIVRETAPHRLGYEGAHFYKLFGRYYAFFIHMPIDAPVSRTNACFWADSLDDEFVGGEIFADDLGFFKSGAAQGGIVDTPEGDWYMTLFQDHGAVGRVPVLVPLRWVDKLPVCGVDGKAPLTLDLPSTRPGYVYAPLVGSDSFAYKPGEKPKDFWQWNHTPDDALWSFENTAYRIRTGKLSPNAHFAVNTLTQRTYGPRSAAEVTLDGSAMLDGDYAGLGALLSCYGFIALKRENGHHYLVMQSRDPEADDRRRSYVDEHPGTEHARVACGPVVRLRVECEFEDKVDEARFYWWDGGEWQKLGPTKKLEYRLDYFMGCRFGLFMYSTESFGGYADFSDFKYDMI